MRKRFALTIAIIAIVMGMSAAVSGPSLSNKDEGMVTHAFKVEMLIAKDGSISVESEFIGPNTVKHDVEAEFTPSRYDWTDLDKDVAQGYLGKVTIYVYGHYNDGDQAYSCEEHKMFEEWILYGAHLEAIQFTCIGDEDYDDTYTNGNPRTYWHDIDTICVTDLKAEVWWGILYQGDIHLKANIYGPEH
ncbi:MAG: hypothetical protein R6V83_10525 [Candidatus Thorarchaeota archaeon]